MKNIKLALCCMVLLSAVLFQSCDSTGGAPTLKDDSKSRVSYAFGAVISLSSNQYGMVEEERNADIIVEGIKEGLKGDSATFANAQKVMQQRVQSKTPAATPEAQKEVARSFGIALIGGLPQEVDIPTESFDYEVLKWSLESTLKGDSVLMAKPEIDSTLNAFFKPYADEFQAKIAAKEQAKAAVEIDAGAKFLAENGTREGVVTLPSGLQYEVVKEGSGAKPTINDEVETHYHGTTIDGSIFDSSVDRGKPATFPVNGVIQGWQEGIPLMSVGAKYNFFIPYNLAYGLKGAPPKIKPGATLIFEVELLAINPTK